VLVVVLAGAAGTPVGGAAGGPRVLRWEYAEASGRRTRQARTSPYPGGVTGTAIGTAARTPRLPWPPRLPRPRRALVREVLGLALLVALVVYGSVREAHPSRAASQAPGGIPVPPWPVYGLVVAASLVLVVRRRHPLAAVSASTGLVCAYAAGGYVDGAALVAPAVGLYHLATARPLHRTLLVAVPLVTALIVVTGLAQPFAFIDGPVPVLPFLAFTAVAIGVAVANRRAVMVAMRERAEHAERDRDAELQRRVDAERLRIARELHDVVAHTMSMINIRAGVAAHVLADVVGGPDAAGAGDPADAAGAAGPSGAAVAQALEALQSIKRGSRDGLRELRAVLQVLRQVDADGDLPTAPAPGLAQLDALLASARAAGLAVSVQVQGPAAPLSPGTDLAAYRIVQEALTNVVRHAGASAATVRLAYGPDLLALRVQDDGRPGPDDPRRPGAPERHGGAETATPGLGIAGMRERVEALGGTLRTGPTPAGGFEVLAELPLDAG